jgi:hypothetical protein
MLTVPWLQGEASPNSNAVSLQTCPSTKRL